MNPYTETQIDENIYVRTFSADTLETDLIWHLDAEDRIIEATHITDWQFQFDDELPQSLEPKKVIQIPKGVIHRIIKGTTPLSVTIKS